MVVLLGKGHKVKAYLLQASKGKDGRQAQPSGSFSDVPHQNRFYNLQTRRHHKGSLDVVTNVFTNHKSLKYVFTQKDFNLFPRRWLVLLKDYDMSILYHPGKKNLVADALSRLSMESVAYNEGGVIIHNGSESYFLLDVKARQDLDLVHPRLVEVSSGSRPQMGAADHRLTDRRSWPAICPSFGQGKE
ncbi:hypothetical protein MTR67_030840 [Solanum verrucosum]|uniref:Uncharacterized protein n=1 Tax=Solanum verrucosum TaxID=315347 RepID=A0AAF0U1D0_SOLVR|nr:hypothetical protein MTR67_030840 [Solanum verrucosum]